MDRVPLPLDPLILESIPDETGFTMPEKIALRNAWKLIQQDLPKHCKDQFLEFYLNNPEMINRYRIDGPKINMKVFHSHATNAFCLIESIIHEGLEGPVQMHALISPVAENHANRAIPKDEVVIYARSTGDYIKEVLKRYRTPTLDQSFDKILDAIIGAHA